MTNSEKPLLTSNARPLIQRLRARRDIPDHSANNGWRTVDPPMIELEAATKIEEQALEITQLRVDLKAAQAAWNAACNAHETEARRCDVEVRAWMIEWPANGNMPARWWHPVTGWMLDANSAVRFVREEDAEAYMRNAGFVKGIVATEHAWIDSQVQQETGLCPHGMPLALSECLPCVGANAQKANSCVCGEPNSPGTHRTDGPCLAPIGDRR